MSRQLKPQSIGPYYDTNTHTTVEMFLDRNDHTFFAKFGDQKYEAASKNELIVQLQKAIHESVNITWAPVIEVKRLEPGHYSMMDRDKDPSFVGFRLARYHYGRLNDGTWVATGWDVPDQLRASARQNLGWGRKDEFNPPCHRQGHSGLPDTYFLPYDEAAWEALIQLVSNIRAVRQRWDAMLSSEDGIGQLVKAITSGMGTKMLGPGEDNADS